MPSLVLLLVARRRELRPRSFGVLAGGFLIGLLPFVYRPLRSAYVSAAGLDPTRALGLPPGRPFWDYYHPATLDGFFRLVTGADFDTRSAFAGFVDVAAYPRFVQAAALRVGGSFGWLGVFGTVLGVLVMASSRRLALWESLLACFRSRMIGSWPGNSARFMSSRHPFRCMARLPNSFLFTKMRLSFQPMATL